MPFIILVAAAGRRGSRDLIHGARSRNSFRTNGLRLPVRIRGVLTRLKRTISKRKREREGRESERTRCNFVAALSGDDSGSSSLLAFLYTGLDDYKRTSLPFSRMTRITHSYPSATHGRTQLPICSPLVRTLNL